MPVNTSGMENMHICWHFCNLVCKLRAGADPGFLDRGFKLAEGGSICAVCLIFPEIPHENEIS